MKCEVHGKAISFIPESIYDGYLLGRLYETSRSKLKVSKATNVSTGIETELLELRFDTTDLIKYLLGMCEV